MKEAKPVLMSWYVIVVVSMSNVLNCLHTYLISAMATSVQHDLKFSGGVEYALMIGPAFIFAKTCSAAPLGKLLETWNRVHLLVACMFVWSAMTALGGAAQNYGTLLALRITQGIFESGCVPIGQSLIFDMAPPGHLGTAMAIYTIGVYIGYGLAVGLGASLTAIYGWRVTLAGAGLLGLPLGVLTLLTVKEPGMIGRGAQHAPQKIVHHTDTSAFLSHWATSPGLLMLCFTCAFRNAGGSIWGYYMAGYYRSQGVSPGVLGEWLSWLPMWAGALGSFLGGFFADRALKWKPEGGRLLLLVFSCIISAPLMILAIVLPAPYSFLCLIPGYACAEMWLGVAMTIMVGLVPDRMRTSSVALYLFIVDNIGSFGLLFVRPIERGFGYQVAMLALVPGVYILAGVTFWGIQPLVARDLKRAMEINHQQDEEDLALNASDSLLKPIESIPRRMSAPAATDTILSKTDQALYGSIPKEEKIGENVEVELGVRPRRASTSMLRFRNASLTDILDMVPADVCWHRGHQCMVCTCTRPKRF